MEDRIDTTRLSEVEPLCVLRLMLRKLYLVILAALIGILGASVVLSTVVSRDYSSTTTFVVTARSGSGTYYSHVSAASETAAIYSELLQSDMMHDAIRHSLGGDVNGTVSARQQGETNLITVTVTSPSAKDALLISQAIVDNYAQLSDYVSSTAVLSVLSAPSVATAVRSYPTARVCALSGALCAAAMLALLAWLSVSGGTVQTTEGARNRLDAKIIGVVPHEKRPESRSDVTRRALVSRLFGRTGGKRLRRNLKISSPAISFAFAESIYRIAARFEHEHAKGRRVFLFSSVSEAEGKSTLAANTALSLAERQQRVLFVDLDLRRPVQSEILGLPVNKSHEFGELLASGAPAARILRAALVDTQTGLHSLLSTKSYADMIELISSPLLQQVLDLARERFDYVIIDSPPLGYFADSELLSDLSDCSVLVVRQDTVPAPHINDAIDALRSGKAEFLGCILNDMRRINAHGAAYGYGKYGYGKYGYGHKHSHVTAESEVSDGTH